MVELAGDEESQDVSYENASIYDEGERSYFDQTFIQLLQNEKSSLHNAAADTSQDGSNYSPCDNKPHVKSSLHYTGYNAEAFSDNYDQWKTLETTDAPDISELKENYQIKTGNLHPADSNLPSQFVAALRISSVSASTWEIPD